MRKIQSQKKLPIVLLQKEPIKKVLAILFQFLLEIKKLKEIYVHFVILQIYFNTTPLIFKNRLHIDLDIFSMTFKIFGINVWLDLLDKQY